MNRWIGAILKSLALGMVATVAAGVVCEQVGRWQDRKRFPQIGRSVDIGGRTLNIYCSGEGGPTVILDSAPGYSWVLIQPQIAKFTRACWYDRAGCGWSDPGPFPRTSEAIARDLHALLRAAAIPPPYVLAGASFGGHNVRVYNGLYPGEVAGMVLVDAAHEEEPDRIPKSIHAPVAPRHFRYLLNLLVQAVARIGLVRMAPRSAPGFPAPRALTPDQWATIQAWSGRQPECLAAGWSSGIMTEENGRQARAAGGLGDRPLIVLTAGKPFLTPRDPLLANDVAAYHQVWMHQLQPQLARLSTRGRQIIVENSTHEIQYEAPDAVVEAVREVVTEIRGGAAR